MTWATLAAQIAFPSIAPTRSFSTKSGGESAMEMIGERHPVRTLLPFHVFALSTGDVAWSKHDQQ